MDALKQIASDPGRVDRIDWESVPFGFMLQPVLGNDLFAGGLILMVIGMVVNFARRVWDEVSTRIRGKFFVSM